MTMFVNVNKCLPRSFTVPPKLLMIRPKRFTATLEYQGETYHEHIPGHFVLSSMSSTRPSDPFTFRVEDDQESPGGEYTEIQFVTGKSPLFHWVFDEDPTNDSFSAVEGGARSSSSPYGLMLDNIVCAKKVAQDGIFICFSLSTPDGISDVWWRIDFQ